MISENRSNFIVLNYKVLQTIIAMNIKSKVIELFCMADDLASQIFNSLVFERLFYSGYVAMAKIDTVQNFV